MEAESIDFNDLLKSRAPLVFVFVLGLAFMLLLVVFRSIVIPVKAIVLNLLSVGAAYGVLVWVFQYGHFEDLLGFESIDGITAWLPLFLFVLLFGLDGLPRVHPRRVREAYDGGMSTDEAISHGSRARPASTSAALVMVFVFAIFATLSALDFKQMGVGLAVAVLIDATIIRAVLLPASSEAVRRLELVLPRQLEWLPEVSSRRAPASRQRGRRRQARSVWESRSTSGTARPGRASGNSTWRAPSSFMTGSSRSRAGTRSGTDLRRLRFMDSSGCARSSTRRGRDEGRHVALVHARADRRPARHDRSRDDRDSGRPRGSRLPGRSRPRLSGTALLGRLLEGPSATIQ